MGRSVDEMSDASLNAEIDNHERHWTRLTEPQKARYVDLITARNARAGYRLEVSRQVIETAARDRRFVSYKDIADANGVEWSKGRHKIIAHLADLIAFGHAKGLPVLSAIVVNKEHLATGAMNDETLAGFVKAVEKLGYTVRDPRAFLRAEQDRLFDHYAGADGT